MKKQKIVQIRDPVLLCGACYWLLARDTTGLLRMGLWAALLHESGHIAVWVLLVHRMPQIRVGLGGLCLQRQQEELSGLRLLGLAMAGPAANLLAAGAVLLAMQHRAGYTGYGFACCNLLLAGFNLLPMPPLDGNYLRLFIQDKLHLRSK